MGELEQIPNSLVSTVRSVSQIKPANKQVPHLYFSRPLAGESRMDITPSPRAGAQVTIDDVTQPDTQQSESNLGNMYRVQENMPFKAYEIERMAEQVFVARLQNMKYEPIRCRELSRSLATEIMDRVRSLAIKRYKLIAMVSIGSLKERPGMQFGSQCLWDKETDNFVSVKYTNSSLFAVAMIYGLLFD